MKGITRALEPIDAAVAGALFGFGKKGILFGAEQNSRL